MEKILNGKATGEDKRQNEIIRIQKKQNNFVMLDKGFLEDERLSFKAKGILAYLLSKPDNWKVIVKDLVNHSKDGKKAVYSGLRELKQYGYYRKVPVRDEDNKVISHWESVIYECPSDEPEQQKKAKTMKPKENSEKSPILPLLTPFEEIQNEEIQKGQRNNIYQNKNNNLNKELSIYPAQAETEADNQTPAEPETIDTIDNEKKEEPEVTKETVADKIGLAELVSEQPDKKEKITELYEIVCDVMTADNADKIRIARRQLPAVMAKKEFSKLGKEHILYVLDCLKKNGSNIRDNSKGYIATSLYNSVHSIGFYRPRSQSVFADNLEPKPQNFDADLFIQKSIKKTLNF